MEETLIWYFQLLFYDILESSIPERPFVNNVYRRSLALAPHLPLFLPPPPSPLFLSVQTLTHSQLTPALYYLNAWNRLLLFRVFDYLPFNGSSAVCCDRSLTYDQSRWRLEHAKEPQNHKLITVAAC